MRNIHILASLSLLALSVSGASAQSDAGGAATAPRSVRVEIARVIKGSDARRVDFRFELGSGLLRGSDGSTTPLTMSGYSAAPDADLAIWTDPITVPASGGVLSFTWTLGLRRGSDAPAVAPGAKRSAAPERRLVAGASALQGIEVVDASTGEKLASVTSRWLRGASGDTVITGAERVDLKSFRGKSIRLRALLCSWYSGESGMERSIARRPVFTTGDNASAPAGRDGSGTTIPDGSTSLK